MFQIVQVPLVEQAPLTQHLLQVLLLLSPQHRYVCRRPCYVLALPIPNHGTARRLLFWVLQISRIACQVWPLHREPLQVLVDLLSTRQLVHAPLTIEPLLLLVLPFRVEHADLEVVAPLTLADVLFAVRTLLHLQLRLFLNCCFPHEVWLQLQIRVERQS